MDKRVGLMEHMVEGIMVGRGWIEMTTSGIEGLIHLIDEEMDMGFTLESDSDKYHGHHHDHPYRRSDMGYLIDEFKKSNPLTFDGEMSKSHHEEALLLGMNRFFWLHDYSKNMKAIIAMFSLKGKENIWWEDVKNVRGIREEDLTWSAFERNFRKKYVSERYYDDKEKEFNELKMKSMIDEEYIGRFFELLRYVPYLKEEKANIQRFISG